MTKAELEILMRMRLFRGFTEASLCELLERLQPHVAEFAKGALLWPMGARVHQAGIVLSGRVEAWHYSANGQQSLAAVHVEGGLFGEILMSAKTVGSPVELRMGRAGKILFLSLDALLERCASGDGAHCAQLLANLLAEISEKYWALQRQVRCLEIPDGRTRLCVWLLQKSGGGNENLIHTGLTREQMARRLGMNRCALSRLLGNLQREGVIVCRRGQFEILDMAALSSIAENA